MHSICNFIIDDYFIFMIVVFFFIILFCHIRYDTDNSGYLDEKELNAGIYAMLNVINNKFLNI
jgi:hypothetical protein